MAVARCRMALDRPAILAGPDESYCLLESGK